MHRGNTVEDQSADASEPSGSWRRNKGDDGISHVKKSFNAAFKNTWFLQKPKFGPPLGIKAESLSVWKCVVANFGRRHCFYPSLILH
jgi:hypothetical protein